MLSMDLLGVLVGKAEDEDHATNICGLFDDCPYSVMNVVRGDMLFLLFFIPEDHRWWLEGIEKDPEKTLGLSEVEVFFSERFGMSREVLERDEPPCGTDCERCDHYLVECKGCPSVYGIEEELHR